MKFINALALFASLALALPKAAEDDFTHSYSTGMIAARQLSSTRTELEAGGACPRVIFIFARASTEVGNMVSPAPCSSGLVSGGAMVLVP
jgi:cutinase